MVANHPPQTLQSTRSTASTTITVLRPTQNHTHLPPTPRPANTKAPLHPALTFADPNNIRPQITKPGAKRT